MKKEPECPMCSTPLNHKTSYMRGDKPHLTTGLCRKCSADRVVINGWKRRGEVKARLQLKQLDREKLLVSLALSEMIRERINRP